MTARLQRSKKALPRRRSDGFTLIELIMAVAAFALVTAGALAAVNSLVQARDAQLQTAQQLQELQLANHNLERDITQMLERGARTGALGNESAVIGQPTLLRGTRAGWGNPLNQHRSNLQRFQYRLDNRRLLREHWVHVDQEGGLPSASTVLIEGVANLQLRYQNQGREWLDNWPPSSGRGGLPRAVEVIIELDDGRRFRRLFPTLAAANE